MSKRTNKDLEIENQQLKNIITSQINWIRSVQDHYNTAISHLRVMLASMEESEESFDGFFSVMQSKSNNIIDGTVVTKEDIPA